jgi:hypothetical protein
MKLFKIPLKSGGRKRKRKHYIMSAEERKKESKIG